MNELIFLFFFKFCLLKIKLFVYINMIDRKFQSKLKKITQKNKKYHIGGGSFKPPKSSVKKSSVNKKTSTLRGQPPQIKGLGPHKFRRTLSIFGSKKQEKKKKN